MPFEVNVVTLPIHECISTGTFRDKVQMSSIDPPYGIKYASNFQPCTDRRGVKD